MNQHISQEEVRRIIISDMVKKRNSIVPVIGEDTIVYKDRGTGKEIPFQEFILNEFQKKYPHVDVSDSDSISKKEWGYYGLSLMSQNYERRFLDDIMDFVNENRSCVKLKDEVFDFQKPTLNWIRSVFEEGLKVLRIYTSLTKTSSLTHETDVVALGSCVQEAINEQSKINPINEVTNWHYEVKCFETSYHYVSIIPKDFVSWSREGLMVVNNI